MLNMMFIKVMTFVIKQKMFIRKKKTFYKLLIIILWTDRLQLIDATLENPVQELTQQMNTYISSHVEDITQIIDNTPEISVEQEATQSMDISFSSPGKDRTQIIDTATEKPVERMQDMR